VSTNPNPLAPRDAIGLAPQSVLQELVQLGGSTKSSFDSHHAPEMGLMDQCVHCGFCLPACPTYALWNEEMDSPRGRIWMMRKGALGEAPLDANFQLHMDNCLGCMACMTACPSGVQYNKLIEDTRGQVERHAERHSQRPLLDRLYRQMLFATFPHKNRLKVMGVPLVIYQRSGLQKLVRASGMLKLLPKRLSAMENLLPQVPLNPFYSLPAEVSAKSHKRGRVGMLSGCVQSAYFSHVNAATARVLAAEGFEVVIPQQQECCGALAMHTGLEESAAAHAKTMIAVFERAGVDTIVINSAGCGSTMKEYGHLLRDEPAWAARAAAFSARCKDISEILAAHEPVNPRHPLPLRVVYHDACHLRHAQQIFAEPRKVLARIPGLEVAELPEPNLCCGSAGVYNLLHPEPAEQLGDMKAEQMLSVNAQAVVSANPGCLLQIMSSLRRRGAEELPAFHMVELVDASIRGLSVEQLLHGKRSLEV